MFQVSSWFGYNTEQKAEEGEKIEGGTSSTESGEDSGQQQEERPQAQDQSSDEVTENKSESSSGNELPFGLPANVNAELAINSAKEWGSYLFNFAKEGTKVVTDTATKTASYLKETVEEKTILGDFHKEQDKFIKEKQHKRSDAAVPPWVGYNEEEQMKQQILALSQDKRNFLRNPPAGVQYHFDFDSSHPVAMATLTEDENLKKMRFNLVPKQINEHNFWRNYFYRVSLIKQSSQLTSLAAETGETSNTSRSSSRRSSTEKDSNHSQAIDIAETGEKSKNYEDDMPPDSPTNEFISDAFNSNLDQADIQKGMEQLGMEKKDEEDKKDDEDEVPEWEKELQQELQEYEVVEGDGGGDNEQWEEEINQMLEES
ncbi:synapse-associated protein 1-like [Glandiceps talaboti]